MTTPLRVLALLALLAAPVQAQTSPAFRLSTAAAITAHGMDLSTTAWCRGAGTCVEANPALRWAADKPVALGAAKMGLAAGLQLLNLKYIHPRSPRGAFWFNVAQTCVFTAIAVRNTRQAPP